MKNNENMRLFTFHLPFTNIKNNSGVRNLFGWTLGLPERAASFFELFSFKCCFLKKAVVFQRIFVYINNNKIRVFHLARYISFRIEQYAIDKSEKIT